MLFRGKKWLFIARTIRKTQIHCVGRKQSLSMVKKVIHIGSLDFKGLKLSGYDAYHLL
jgi:hypothetical protein